MVERRLRWVVAVATAVMVVLGAVVATAMMATSPVAVVVPAAIIAVGTALVSTSTSWVMLLEAGVVVAAVTAICSDSAGNPGWFALCIVVGGCVVRGRPRFGLATAVVVIAIFVVEWVAFDDDPGWANWIAGTAFTLLVTLLFHRQRELMEQLRAAQAGLADRARAEERNRIARELHDVIAHSLTVSLLHVSSARLAVEEDPAEAAASLAEAERLGRASLAEVRQAVGMVRGGAEGGGVAPLPGADQLDSLVEGFRRAGSTVGYQVTGDPTTIGATAGLGLYRIMQEALTNAARHAPGAVVEVRLSTTPERTELVVDSAGPPVPARGGGIGLHSMGERAAALGGEVVAGPFDGGWRVHAVVPHEHAAAR